MSLARSSTMLRIRKSQASPLTAGNCIRGLNPCPLQSHSRAHPRFGQPTLPDWERLSRNSSNTTTIHTGHTPLSISRGPGWCPPTHLALARVPLCCCSRGRGRDRHPPAIADCTCTDPSGLALGHAGGKGIWANCHDNRHRLCTSICTSMSFLAGQ